MVIIWRDGNVGNFNGLFCVGGRGWCGGCGWLDGGVFVEKFYEGFLFYLFEVGGV